MWADNLKNLPIGVLDSGVGGLTVLRELKVILPNENYIYFGDTKNLPYGTKSVEELYTLVVNILNFFEKQNVKAAVFGCNTTAATVYELVKDKYKFPIYPIIQGACKKINASQYHRIGVFATSATVNSKTYTKYLKAENNKLEVFEMACPHWVEFVEQQTSDTQIATKDITERLNEMMGFEPEKVILGCTHYPYLENKLIQISKKNIFLNPSKLFVEYIKEDLMRKNLLTNDKKSSQKIYVSAAPENFFRIGKLFFPMNELPQLYKG